MAYVITDSCVNCGTCEGECPVGAISAGDSKYEIDASSCVWNMCWCLSYRSYRVRVICTCTNRTVTDVAVLFFVCIYSFCNSFFLFKNVMVLPAI